VDAAIAPADCVVANILAGTLIELAPALTNACAAGANMLLSGILTSQSATVIGAFRPAFDIVSCERRDDWCCIHAHRRAVHRGNGAV
jgi:ribosomal protein L11 methyltransferase